MKKKGFTLIELLAVIVILAILALIAIPIVISIIRDSRENAHKRSIETFARSIENSIAMWQSKNDGELPKYISDYEIKISGEKVVCDNEIKGLDGDDGIELTNCYVVDSKGKQKSKYTYTYKNRTLIISDEEENQNFSIGQEVTIKGEKYNVIGQGSDYLTLLKQLPLTVDEVNENRIGNDGINHVNRYTFFSQGTADNSSYNGTLAYYSSAECGYSTPENYGSLRESGCEIENVTNYDTSDIKYIVDNWSNKRFQDNELKEINGYRSRLIKKEELQQFYPSCNLQELVCVIESTTPSWLYDRNHNYWYWTMSSYNNYMMWHIDDAGYLIARGNTVYSSSGGLRPVINIYKSAI